MVAVLLLPISTVLCRVSVLPRFISESPVTSMNRSLMSGLRVCAWRNESNDVYVYFDNDAKVHAPHDAMALMGRVHGQECGVPSGFDATADRLGRETVTR